MSGGDIGRATAVVAVFAFAGPLVGTTLILGVLGVAILMTNPENGLVTLLMWPFAAVLGMMIGFVPALLTGLVMAALSRRLKTRLLWAGAATLCGVLATALVYRLADLGQDPMTIIVCGGGSALICALLTLGLRPRSGAPPSRA